MKYYDITPDELKCPAGDCPSIHRAADGSSYRITGKDIQTYLYIAGESNVEIDAKLLEGALGVASLEAKIIEQAKRIQVLEDINHNLGEAVRKSPIPWVKTPAAE